VAVVVPQEAAQPREGVSRHRVPCKGDTPHARVPQAAQGLRAGVHVVPTLRDGEKKEEEERGGGRSGGKRQGDVKINVLPRAVNESPSCEWQEGRGMIG